MMRIEPERAQFLIRTADQQRHMFDIGLVPTREHTATKRADMVRSIVRVKSCVGDGIAGLSMHA
jgi:hypothetical protein